MGHKNALHFYVTVRISSILLLKRRKTCLRMVLTKAESKKSAICSQAITTFLELIPIHVLWLYFNTCKRSHNNFSERSSLYRPWSNTCFVGEEGEGEILQALTLDVYKFFNKLKPRNLVTFLTSFWEQFGIARTCPSSLTFDRSFL